MMWAQRFLGRPVRLLVGILLPLGFTCPRAVAQSEPKGSIHSKSADIDQNSGEIDSSKIEEFVPKLPIVLKSKPNDPDTTLFGEPELGHGPLETRWNGVPVVMVFYQVQVTTVKRRLTHSKGPKDTVSFYMERIQDGCVKGYVFVPAGKKGRFKPIFIGDILPNGGDPKIESVFFANADKDKQKELLVISSSRFNHRALGLSGTNYDVAVFDDFTDARKDSLREMQDVEEKISVKSGSNSEEDGPSEQNGFTSAAEVKRCLKQLGY